MNNIFKKFFSFITLSIFCLGTTLSANCQITAEDIFKDGTRFVSKAVRVGSSKNYYKEVSYINHTTVINGKEYLKLFKYRMTSSGSEDNFLDLPESTLNGTGTLIALLRVENNTIYSLNFNRPSIDDPSELTYFDFNLNQGELFETRFNVFANYFGEYLSPDEESPLHRKLLAQKKGKIKSCGRTYDIIGLDVLYEDMPQWNHQDYWIIGIGSNCVKDGFDQISDGESTPLDHIIVDGEIVYRADDFDEQNITWDTSDITNIEDDKSPMNDSYTLSGIKSTSNKGIVIRNGKIEINK